MQSNENDGRTADEGARDILRYVFHKLVLHDLRVAQGQRGGRGGTRVLGVGFAAVSWKITTGTMSTAKLPLPSAAARRPTRPPPRPAPRPYALRARGARPSRVA